MAQVLVLTEPNSKIIARI